MCSRTQFPLINYDCYDTVALKHVLYCLDILDLSFIDLPSINITLLPNNLGTWNINIIFIMSIKLLYFCLLAGHSNQNAKFLFKYLQGRILYR